MVSALVLGCICLALVGCVWTARRYLRAQRAALPPPVVITGAPGALEVPPPDNYREAA